MYRIESASSHDRAGEPAPDPVLASAAHSSKNGNSTRRGPCRYTFGSLGVKSNGGDSDLPQSRSVQPVRQSAFFVDWTWR